MSRESKFLGFTRFEHFIECLDKKMTPDETCSSWKVIDLVEIYNIRVKLFYIRVHMK
jgi:hypothetical protein